MINKKDLNSALFVLALLPFMAANAETMAESMRAIAGTTNYRQVAMSPDARRLAWVQTVPHSATSSSIGTSILIDSSEGPSAPHLVAAPHPSNAKLSDIAEDNIVWSPDSMSLAFLSDAESPGQKQLYIYKTSDGTVRRLTSLRGNLAAPSWSPNGRVIAFLFTENSDRTAGPLAAVASPTGVIDDHALEQRIAEVELAYGHVKQISPADLYVYEFDWSPDGATLVGTAAHGSGDNNWYVAELYTIDTTSGNTHSIFKTDMQIAAPRWSPNGRFIAFIGGLSSDESIASGDAYVIAAAGGNARPLTSDRKGSAFWLTWRSAGEILLAEAVNGGSALTSVNTKTGTVKEIYQDAVTLRAEANPARSISLAANHKSGAVIRESFNEPPAIWSGPIGGWHKRVSPPSSYSPSWGTAVNVSWQSGEYAVQGWLVPPKHIEPDRRYPLIVWVHGGPAWLTAPSWPDPLEDSRSALLAAHHYFVFYPNPRGSAGFGEAFKRANVKDFGGGDLRDILEGVDHLVATQPIDGQRVGITGWSYGGFMTMWAITQTQRFKAAVSGAGLSNWLSYYGENGIDEWMLPYFGASVYDDPGVYAKSSPINFIKRVRTPTLLMVGDSDVECPPPQSFEYWHALKEYKVDTELVVYPHEGHRFTDPHHAIDVMERMLGWFDRYMPPAP